MPIFRLSALAAAAFACALPAAAQQQDPIVITGSIVERAVADAPYAIGVVGRDELRSAGPQVNLSEGLARVPGLVIGNRSNFAQDLQISSRGFGARSGFGVRGVRLFYDGIPATGPDGQGQVSQFDLANAERVEVLRGPFSVLYGNSSGGVINVVAAPVKGAGGEAEADAGSFGLRQLRGTVGLPFGDGMDLRLGVQAMNIDGFRPHSGAKKRIASARFGWKTGSDTLVASGGHFEQPADDPLGLTRAQFDADALQTTPQALQYDTRKTQSQDQVGASWKHRFEGEGALREIGATAYLGQRSVTQYLAIAPATQVASPRHGGGVVDFDRDFGGVDARARWSWNAFDLQAGAAVDTQRDARRGYENFTGPSATPTALGVIGSLRRDETDRARTTDVYAQGEWSFAPDWAASAGVRHGRVKLEADDRYLANGDDSGAMSFGYTNPVLGLRWQAVPGLHLHASWARGFESPTLNDVAYRADGTSGLNTALKPQKSRQGELGAKWRGSAFDADLAVFRIDVDDEIGVATNSGGRSAFQNVGRTARRGAELGAGGDLGAGLRTRLALSWLDATYRDAFVTCINTPCVPAKNQNVATVAPGNRIAGTGRGTAFGELAWAGGGWGEWGLELRGGARVAVNDTNSDFAPGWSTVSLRWSQRWPLGQGRRLELLVRGDNLADKRYAGTVIVNEGNQRYFETAAPRSFLVALRFVGGGV